MPYACIPIYMLLPTSVTDDRSCTCMAHAASVPLYESNVRACTTNNWSVLGWTTCEQKIVILIDVDVTILFREICFVVFGDVEN